MKWKEENISAVIQYTGDCTTQERGNNCGQPNMQTETLDYPCILSGTTTSSLDPRPHFPLHLEKWAWYRPLAHALISPRYLGVLDNIVYAQ